MSEIVTILGSGPGGYKSALHAAEEGYDVNLIEKSDVIGGVCTNRGCIPSKALLSIAERIDDINDAKRKGIDASIQDIDNDRVRSLKEKAVEISRKGIEKNIDKDLIDIFQGEGKISDNGSVEVNGQKIETDYIVIATGSEPIKLPDLDVDEKDILTSKGALNLEEIPDSMLIIGGGYIGVELAFVYSSLGTEVTIVELLDRVLPNMDKDLSKEAHKILKRKRIKIHTGSEVTDVKKDDLLTVDIEGDTEKRKEVGKVLCSVGRKPTPPVMPSDMEEDMIGDKGQISTDDFMKTDIDGIYAVGDVNGKSMLAHSAYKQAKIAIDHIAGDDLKGFSDYHVPAGVYTSPEIASVGLTREEAGEEYDEVSIGKYPISRLGRGYSTGKRTGVAKVIAGDGKLLGLHLVCPGATDMIMEGGAILKSDMSVEEVADMIHPHPTFSEAVQKAIEQIDH